MNPILLEKFEKELNQIREYLKHIEYVNDVIGYTIVEDDNERITNLLSNLKEHHKSFRIDKLVCI